MVSPLELYFKQFRDQIIGINQEFTSPFGIKKIIYTDWTASGRLYRPIEEKLINDLGSKIQVHESQLISLDKIRNDKIKEIGI